MLKKENIKLGAQPIIWSNDDFHDLGGETPLETCLSEMQQAGYQGTELGHKFPKDAGKLKPILQKYSLQLVSGWHSSYLAESPYKQEETSFREHLNFLKAMGSPVVIVAECASRIYHDPKLALDWDFKKEAYSKDQWSKVFEGLEQFSRIAESEGMKLVYHHHMGTTIQNEKQVERLMSSTDHVRMLFDTGHLAFAGENPLTFVKKYKSKISHVHLKNVRFEIVDRARNEKWTFERAVREGVFTVPGDGGIDYKPIFAELGSVDYKGWMVVEAEQDPKKANPLDYAKRARNYIREVIGI
jgi:inosose dehydratase